jgi:CBS domain-containing protein
MQARELMTENPVCCQRSETLPAVARLMLDYNCGMVPVVESEEQKRLVGIITDRDIVCRVLAKGMDCQTTTVETAMTTGRLWTVSADTDVDEVIDKMEQGQVRRIPVLDENDCVVGVISTADIALELEEVDEIAEVFEEISEPSETPRM